MQDGFSGDTTSNCFYSAFAVVQQTDFWVLDIINFEKTWNFFNVLVFTPTHIQGNFSAAYEYCNFYIYIVQASLISMLDFGYISELTTRYSMVFSSELQPFLLDMNDLFAEPILDFYAVGFRWGMLWKILFDVKITS
jgi:hypothetical protein